MVLHVIMYFQDLWRKEGLVHNKVHEISSISKLFFIMQIFYRDGVSTNLLVTHISHERVDDDVLDGSMLSYVFLFRAENQVQKLIRLNSEKQKGFLSTRFQIWYSRVQTNFRTKHFSMIKKIRSQIFEWITIIMNIIMMMTTSSWIVCRTCFLWRSQYTRRKTSAKCLTSIIYDCHWTRRVNHLRIIQATELEIIVARGMKLSEYLEMKFDRSTLFAFSIDTII